MKNAAVAASRSPADDDRRAQERLIQRLVERRKQCEITQAEMATLLKRRNQSEVAKIETGERTLRLQDLVRWAWAVGDRPADYLDQYEADLRSRPRVRLREP